MASKPVQGPPYLPTTWALGGTPNKSVDIPVTAVFLVLFIISAATHMTIFQKNNKKGHKFLFNAALFGFSMSRIVTCILRIASLCLPTDLSLAIAATIFVAAGVLIAFIINLLFAKRILRAYHPTIGWHRAINTIYMILYVLIGLTLIVTITSVVQNFYTLRPRTKFIDRALMLYGQTFLAVVSSLPIFIVGITIALPRHGRRPEKFGAGKMRIKIAMLLTGTSLLTLGAWYRAGTSWQTPVPRTQRMPADMAKPAFYVMNFGVEILVLYMYALLRVDIRFHVPDGARGPGSYTVRAKGGDEEEGQAGREGEKAGADGME